MAPVWLKRQATLNKICEQAASAAAQGCQLVVFGEALLPGYPFWLSFTNGAQFDSSIQKEIFAHYAAEAVQIGRGDLDIICSLAKEKSIAIYLGIVERPMDRGGHSLYCSLVYIDSQGVIQSVHRKLQPTYEERLVWAIGDGHGLVTHAIGDFRIGGLNCWENWMPLARSALYAQGMNLLISVWPGSQRNTADITRFIAKESRSYVASVSGMLSKDQLTGAFPHADSIRDQAPAIMADGGSCLAGPNGDWIIPPAVGQETIAIATIDRQAVLKERQNFDPSGHYGRPDVTQLTVNQNRQSIFNSKKQSDPNEI